MLPVTELKFILRPEQNFLHINMDLIDSIYPIC